MMEKQKNREQEKEYTEISEGKAKFNIEYSYIPLLLSFNLFQR